MSGRNHARPSEFRISLGRTLFPPTGARWGMTPACMAEPRKPSWPRGSCGRWRQFWRSCNLNGIFQLAMRSEKQLPPAPDLAYLGRMALLGEMFAEAAHEINNIMGAAAAYVELELHQPGGTESSTRLKSVLDLTHLAGELAVNVLHFSSPVNADIGRVAEAVDAVLGLFRYRERRGVRFVRRGRKKLPAVRMPTNHLQLALANIVRNALDAVDEARKPVIRIGTRSTGKEVTIEIWNSGRAIPADVLPHLFQRFYTTKPSGKGTGLGLAIAHRLVTEAGGQLTATNPPKGGVAFTLTLPTVHVRTTRDRHSDTPAPQPTLSGHHVLVVDDDDSMRQVLRLLLRDMGHANVDVCASGQEALERLSHRKYDAVVLDLRMPGLSGQELYERMPAPVKKRVVFITGDTMRETTSGFLRLTRQPALIKPILSRDLFDAVSKVTAAHTASQH